PPPARRAGLADAGLDELVLIDGESRTEERSELRLGDVPAVVPGENGQSPKRLQPLVRQPVGPSQPEEASQRRDEAARLANAPKPVALGHRHYRPFEGGQSRGSGRGTDDRGSCLKRVEMRLRHWKRKAGHG